MARPQIIVVAGPNGAGRSTCAATSLPPGLDYLNADEVAKGLPGYPSRQADMQAGRIVLDQMQERDENRQGFAVETTLASRSLAARITRLKVAGYKFRLIFLWTPNADFSIQRVAFRVRSGGHDIPEETIRRRHSAGSRNFFQLYQPSADTWDVLDNTGLVGPRFIASGRAGLEPKIADEVIWSEMVERGSDESR